MYDEVLKALGNKLWIPQNPIQAGLLAAAMTGLPPSQQAAFMGNIVRAQEDELTRAMKAKLADEALKQQQRQLEMEKLQAQQLAQRFGLPNPETFHNTAEVRLALTQKRYEEARKLQQQQLAQQQQQRAVLAKYLKQQGINIPENAPLNLLVSLYANTFATDKRKLEAARRAYADAMAWYEVWRSKSADDTLKKRALVNIMQKIQEFNALGVPVPTDSGVVSKLYFKGDKLYINEPPPEAPEEKPFWDTWLDKLKEFTGFMEPLGIEEKQELPSGTAVANPWYFAATKLYPQLTSPKNANKFRIIGVAPDGTPLKPLRLRGSEELGASFAEAARVKGTPVHDVIVGALITTLASRDKKLQKQIMPLLKAYIDNPDDVTFSTMLDILRRVNPNDQILTVLESLKYPGDPKKAEQALLELAKDPTLLNDYLRKFNISRKSADNFIKAWKQWKSKR